MKISKIFWSFKLYIWFKPQVPKINQFSIDFRKLLQIRESPHIIDNIFGQHFVKLANMCSSVIFFLMTLFSFKFSIIIFKHFVYLFMIVFKSFISNDFVLTSITPSTIWIRFSFLRSSNFLLIVSLGINSSLDNSAFFIFPMLISLIFKRSLYEYFLLFRL